MNSRSRHRFGIRFVLTRFACLVSAFTLAMAVNPVAAQQTDAADFQALFGKSMDSDEAASDAAPNGENIDQVAYQNEGASEVDIWTQVAELRSRLAVQEQELSQFRDASVASLGAAKTRGSSDWFATYESVLVAPMQQNATGLIVETDNGYSHVGFPWLIEHSPRVQFGREAAGESLGWRLRYWQFRHMQSFDANDANGLIPTGNEGTAGYLSEFGDITTGLGFIQEGSFHSTIRTDVIDWELQRNLTAPLDFYAGLRYAKISQGYMAVTDQGVVQSQSEFRGIGPTASIRFLHPLPLDTLSLFANLRGSMLFGSKTFSAFDDTNMVTQSINSIDLRSGNDNADTLAGNAEMQLGLRYAPLDHFNISVAIESQYYSNVGGPNPTAVFTGADGGINGDGPMDDGLGFLGLTVGTELRW